MRALRARTVWSVQLPASHALALFANKPTRLPPNLRLVTHEQMAPGRAADEAGAGDLLGVVCAAA